LRSLLTNDTAMTPMIKKWELAMTIRIGSPATLCDSSSLEQEQLLDQRSVNYEKD
jgi:hypothetical protein